MPEPPEVCPPELLPEFPWEAACSCSASSAAWAAACASRAACSASEEASSSLEVEAMAEFRDS